LKGFAAALFHAAPYEEKAISKFSHLVKS